MGEQVLERRDSAGFTGSSTDTIESPRQRTSTDAPRCGAKCILQVFVRQESERSECAFAKVWHCMALLLPHASCFCSAPVNTAVFLTTVFLTTERPALCPEFLSLHKSIGHSLTGSTRIQYIDAEPVAGLHSETLGTRLNYADLRDFFALFPLTTPVFTILPSCDFAR